MSTKQSYRPVLIIGLIMAFRMLGLFMIFPIFSIAAKHLPGSTPFLIGAAFAIYGLTQACLQIPLGTLSDRIGRKSVIALGLILFALGSLVAATASSIWGIIIGRGLQGMGAIGSTSLAFIADVTRDENRSKAMAAIGMIFGLSFAAALIIGPAVYGTFGLSGIFYLTVIFAAIALPLLFLLPNPPKLTQANRSKTDESDQHQINKQKNFIAILKRPQLMRLNFSIFAQHAIMVILFLDLPHLLSSRVGLSAHQQTPFYLIVLFIAFFAMVPFIINAEKNRRIKGTLLSAIATLGLSQLLLWVSPANVWNIGIILCLFFTAFTLLESILPSLVSKMAPLTIKGAAMGVYSTSQFFGIAFGGALGGFISAHFGHYSVYLLNCAICLCWFGYLWSLANIPYASTIIVKCDTLTKNQQFSAILTQMSGIKDFAFAEHEQLLYIKADKKIISENKLRNSLENANLKL
jgi:MFS family permease